VCSVLMAREKPETSRREKSVLRAARNLEVLARGEAPPPALSGNHRLTM
jgi:hypothetical protein